MCDFCRILKKKQKHSELKEHVKNWSDKTYEVVGKHQPGLNGQTTYKLEGFSKGYFRNELLLVEWNNYLISKLFLHVKRIQ